MGWLYTCRATSAAFQTTSPFALETIPRSPERTLSFLPNDNSKFSRQSCKYATVVSDVEETIDASQIREKIILFDGVCNFCNTWVDLLLRIDVNKKFKFTPLQSDIGKSLLLSIGKEADDISSVILVDQTTDNSAGKAFHDKSAAVLKVVEELGPIAVVFTKSAETLIPKQYRDSIYDVVADNRYSFLGKREECRCSDPKFSDRFL